MQSLVGILSKMQQCMADWSIFHRNTQSTAIHLVGREYIALIILHKFMIQSNLLNKQSKIMLSSLDYFI